MKETWEKQYFQLFIREEKNFWWCSFLQLLFTGLPQITFAGANKVVALQQSKTAKGQGERFTRRSHYIGATVMVKGSTNGTVTDIDGNFTLNNVSHGTLVISYVGFVSKEVSYQSGESMSVTMKEDYKALWWSGGGRLWYIQKKANLTGSVAREIWRCSQYTGCQYIHHAARSSARCQYCRPMERRSRRSWNPCPWCRYTWGYLEEQPDGSYRRCGEQYQSDVWTGRRGYRERFCTERCGFGSYLRCTCYNGVILVTTKRGGEQKPTITYSGNIAIQKATILPDYVNSFWLGLPWCIMSANPERLIHQICFQKLKDGSDPDHFRQHQLGKRNVFTAVMHRHPHSMSVAAKLHIIWFPAQYMDQDGIMKNQPTVDSISILMSTPNWVSSRWDWYCQSFQYIQSIDKGGTSKIGCGR